MKEVSMKRQILAGAMSLALAAGMTSSAMASHHYGHHSGYGGWHHADLDSRQFVGGYEARQGLSGLGEGTYCPAYSRCGAGLPN
jgi:hypothetical protein